MLRYALGQLIDYDPITESSRNFDLNGLGLLDLVMPNAVYGSRDQLLVAWDRLLLQPHVQLVLDVLHFEFGIASHSCVVFQHPSALNHNRDAFAPDELQTHAE